MTSFVVKAKAGAIVREGIELDSTLVTTLATGARVTVEERATSSKKAARCRVVAEACGSAGWLSEKMLEAAPAPKKRKPVVAALHGTAANGAIFKMQLSPFLPKLTEIADVRFVDGPKDIDPENPQAAMMRQFFGAKRRPARPPWPRPRGVSATRRTRAPGTAGPSRRAGARRASSRGTPRRA